MKILSWNVNGIRACMKKGFREWFEKEKIDILCLQEIKACEESFPEELLNLQTHKCYLFPAQKKGYSGVAILSSNKIPLLDLQKGMNILQFDQEGRTLIAEYDDFILLSCYFPNGRPDHGRVPFKLKYCREIQKLALKLAKEKGKGVIIAGDYNTAHTEIDLARPKDNENTTGFLPIERAWIDEFIQAGFLDIFRIQHPKLLDQYTWWSYRTFARKRNVGWRIDYFFVSKNLKDRVKSSFILSKVEGSDHCPLGIELK